MTASIRQFRIDDIPAGLELCRIAGWNQLEADWQRLMKIQPDGVFVAERDGKVCGTASGVCHGDRVAWIGMILVHPDLRGQGIGSQLMRACIDFLRPRVRTIKLDATDQGRPVYLKLGFRDERPTWRMVASTAPEQAHDAPKLKSGYPNVSEAHWPQIAKLDAAAFGADRLALLKVLSTEGPSAVAAVSGNVRAYGFLRPGFNAWQLGPVVAEDFKDVPAVLASLGRVAPVKTFWDILPENQAAMAIAKSLGFEPIRKLTRMYLGDEPYPGSPELVFAGAGFELG